MAKKTKLIRVEITPLQGGVYMPEPSAELPGISNYTEKLNFRLRAGAEETLPGWDYFPGVPLLITDEPVMLLDELIALNELRVPIAATLTRLYYYDSVTEEWTIIGTGFSEDATYWEFVTIAGQAVFNNGIDLPVTWEIGDAAVLPIYELREAGVARVGALENNQEYLLCGDITEIEAESMTAFMNNPAGYVVPGQDAYGNVVDTSILLHYPSKSIWSDPGNARRWKVGLYGSYDGAGQITLEFPVRMFETGMTLNMGGDISGATITTIDVTRTLLTTDATFATPIVRDLVVRSDYEELLSGYDDLMGQGGKILRIKTLQEYAVIFQEGAIRLGLTTGVKDQPFTFERVYAGSSTLFYRDICMGMNDAYVLFAGREHFYMFDLTTRRPSMHSKLDLHRREFFSTALQGKVIAGVNRITGDMWLSNWSEPEGFTLVYDQKSDSVYRIDTAFTATGNCLRPGATPPLKGTDNWFIMGTLDGSILLNEQDEDGNTIYHRCGEDYACRIRSGLSFLNDSLDQKTLRAYSLGLSSHSANNPTTIRLLRASSPSNTPEIVASKIMDSPKTRNYWPVHYSFDLLGIEIEASGNSPITFSHHVIEYFSTSAGRISRLV